MDKSKRKDFTVRPYSSVHRGGDDLHGVYVGKTILHSICQGYDAAIEMAKNLNADPWHYDKLYWKQANNHRLSLTKS
jgi:hypothetical protein